MWVQGAFTIQFFLAAVVLHFFRALSDAFSAKKSSTEDHSPSWGESHLPPVTYSFASRRSEELDEVALAPLHVQPDVYGLMARSRPWVQDCGAHVLLPEIEEP